MASWRTVTGLIVTLAVAGTARAQTYPLKEDTAADTCTRVKLGMALAGELKVQQEGKAIALKESAAASHDFYERVLEPGTGGLIAKAARHYLVAKVGIAVADSKIERALGDKARKLLAVQRIKDTLVVFSPHDLLTRDELQLTEHLDTLALPGLLPGRDVAVGDTWKVANPVVQALCRFSGLTSQELTGKLEQVKDEIATVSFTGPAAGIDLGAEVKVAVQATGRFDLKCKRLVGLAWKQTDERAQGPVSPAAKAEITYTVERSPLPEPAGEVNDYALVPIPRDKVPADRLTLLRHRDHRGLYELQHSREWHTVAQTDEHLVQRLMDRGQFVAQVTLTPWKKVEAGKHFTPEEFKQILANMPGWTMGSILRDEEVKEATNGNWIYLVAAEGEMDGLKALQYFYLVAGSRGDQLLVAFTMTPGEVQKLGTRDMGLLRGLTLPAGGAGEKR